MGYAMALFFYGASALNKGKAGGPRASLGADRSRAWRRFPTGQGRGMAEQGGGGIVPHICPVLHDLRLSGAIVPLRKNA